MDTSRKSLRAYSVAQTIKKQIDDTLFRVQLQKRKFLTLEREETHLKDSYQKKLKNLNELKAKEPQTKTHSTRVWQTKNIIDNVDRNYLSISDKIQQLKRDITLHRREICKYKDTNNKLQEDIHSLIEQNQQTNNENIRLENENEDIKEEIIGYRLNNIKNAGQFYQSFNNVNKSNAQDQNHRKKVSMKQKNFLGEEMKNSKIIPFDGLSQALRESGVKFADQVDEVMTESVPLAKERIKTLIYKNKEKLKITEAYRKFGENLQQMFLVMKEYKGRDDLNFIAEEFVTKERQLQKLEEYIGQLESRILTAQVNLKTQKTEDDRLREEVTAKAEKNDRHYADKQLQIEREIVTLKEKEYDFYIWFNKVSNILAPLSEQPLGRGNASNMIGDIEQSLNLKPQSGDKKNPAKVSVPVFESTDYKQSYNELLSYERMRQMAADYVRNKK